MTRMRLIASSFVALLVFSPSAARAGWSPTGATIKSTSLELSRVAACPDGADGWFVFWQESPQPTRWETAPGIVRAQHVLATGDPDPAWSADGVVVCDVSAARPEIRAVADGLGGAYVWWMEQAQLYVLRVGSTGVSAAGWPARGRLLGTLPSANLRPSVLRDTGNGIYAVWVQQTGSTQTVRAIHIGSDNLGAGGWPETPRTIRAQTGTNELWPQLALADDGGIFVAWGTSPDLDPESGTWNLARLTTSGLAAAGWPTGGIDIAPCRVGAVTACASPLPDASLIALSRDGRGGVFLWIEDFIDVSSCQDIEFRLRRLQGDGSPAAGWTADGTVISIGIFPGYPGDPGPEGGLKAIFDGTDGVLIGAYSIYGTDSPPEIPFAQRTDAGAGYQAGWLLGASGSAFVNIQPFEYHEILPNGRGGLFIASCVPWGPYGPYDQYPRLTVTQSVAAPGWTDWSEIQWVNGPIHWFGDVAMASAPDGGVAFFWSQQHDRFGLFARRFGPGGQVTGVEPPQIPDGADLGAPRPNPARSGEVGLVPVRLEAAGEVALALVDVRGRMVARRVPERLAAGEHLVRWNPGRVPPGVYFLTMRTESASKTTRWVLLR